MTGDDNASRPVRKPRKIVSYGGAGNTKTKVTYGGRALVVSNGSNTFQENTMDKTDAKENAKTTFPAARTDESIQRDEQDNARVKPEMWAKAIFILLLPIIGGCVTAAMGASFWIGLIAGGVVHSILWRSFRKELNQSQNQEIGSRTDKCDK